MFTRLSRCTVVSSLGTHFPFFLILPKACNLSEIACWVTSNFSACCCFVRVESWSSSSRNSASLIVGALPEHGLSLKGVV